MEKPSWKRSSSPPNRRAQNLYEIPISVTVASGESLQAVGARDISAIADFAPQRFFRQRGDANRRLRRDLRIHPRHRPERHPADHRSWGRALRRRRLCRPRRRIAFSKSPMSSASKCCAVPREPCTAATPSAERSTSSRAHRGDKQALTMRATTGSDERLDSFRAHRCAFCPARALETVVRDVRSGGLRLSSERGRSSRRQTQPRCSRAVSCIRRSNRSISRSAPTTRA